MAVVSRAEFEAKASEKPFASAQVVAIPELPDVSVNDAPESFKVEPVKRKPNGKDPWFYLQHPDCTDSFKPDCTMTVVGETVEIKGGRVDTQVEAVRDELIRQSWRWMNEEF